MEFSRRSVTSCLIAGTAAAFAPRVAFAAERADVIVIGAGFAGLQTARLLEKSGARVIVLEGAARLGGRAQTGDRFEGRPELGATQIGAGYTEVRRAVDELGIRLEPEDRDIEPFAFYLNGKLVGAADWEASAANLTVGAERALLPSAIGTSTMARLNPLVANEDWMRPEFLKYDVAVGSLLKSAGLSDEAIRIAEIAGTGGDIWGVSALAMFQESVRTTNERKRAGARDTGKSLTYSQPTDIVMNWVVEGGTSRLVEAMAGSLRQPVRTNAIVTAILQDRAGVEVRTMDGGRYRAQRAVFAAPFNMLRLLTLDPGPPVRLAEAIEGFSTANTARAWLRVTEPFWEQDGLEPSLMTDEGFNMMWVYKRGKRDQGEWRAMFVATGDAARRLDLMPDADRPAKMLDMLARVRPSTKGKVRWITYKSWAQDPMVQTCRNIYGPGQVGRFREAVFSNHERLFFAGDQCRRTGIGMEAAFESAVYAAKAVAA